MESKIYELELNTLYAISREMGQVFELDRTLSAVLKILSKNLSMERGTVTLKDAKTGLLKIIASHGLDPQEKRRGIYAPGEGVTGAIFETAQPFAVPDIGREPLFLNRTQARNLTKNNLAFIGVPIVLNSEPIGVLSVDRLFGSEVDFQEDIRFLTIVATLMAHFVDLNREVERREETLVTENRSLRAEVSAKYNHFFCRRDQSCHAASEQDDPQGRPQSGLGPLAGRVRNRKDADGANHPRTESAPTESVYQGQLCLPPGQSDRVGIVRS